MSLPPVNAIGGAAVPVTSSSSSGFIGVMKSVGNAVADFFIMIGRAFASAAIWVKNAIVANPVAATFIILALIIGTIVLTLVITGDSQPQNNASNAAASTNNVDVKADVKTPQTKEPLNKKEVGEPAVVKTDEPVVINKTGSPATTSTPVTTSTPAPAPAVVNG